MDNATALYPRNPVDVASEDSFPASDPPAWTPIVGIGPACASRWHESESPHPTAEESHDAKKDATDAAAITRLASEAGKKLRGRLSGLRLQLHGNGIVICGTARSFHAKQLALNTVMAGTSLPVVRNEIEVV